MDSSPIEACTVQINDPLSSDDGNPLPGLTCPVCTEVFVNPVFVTCCGNTFCRECLEKSLVRSDACPLCRAPLLEGLDYILPNRAVQELISAAKELKRSLPSESTAIKIESESSDNKLLSDNSSSNLNNLFNMKLISSQIRTNVSSGDDNGSQQLRAPRFLSFYGSAVQCIMFFCPGRLNFLIMFRRIIRWFILNEARLRFMLYMATTAFLVIYLRVQEELYVHSNREVKFNKFHNP